MRSIFGRTITWAAIGLAGCHLAGCAPSRSQLVDRLQADDPAVRSRTIRQIAEMKDMGLAPELVKRLSDEDAAVRFCAISALEQMTGLRLGYSYGATAGQRQEAVAAWRAYFVDREQWVDRSTPRAELPVGKTATSDEAPATPASGGNEP